MPVTASREHIISLHVDAVVNPATPPLTAGEGVSAEIFAAAGQRKLTAACRRIGYCETGHSVITKGYDLPAKYVIHAVGPIWHGESAEELMSSAYRSALELAAEMGCASLAVPLLSVGRYGCPPEESLKIALREIRAFLDSHEMMILLAIPEESRPVLEEERLRAVREYVDAHIRFQEDAFAAPAAYPPQVPPQEDTLSFSPLAQAVAPGGKRSLAEVLRNLDESFSRMLMRLIDEKGYTDTEVYKRANIDRKLFSKLRKEGYVPSKPTVLVLAIAMRLNLDETRDFLARAGYALSPSSKSDVIVEYFISQGIFDLFEINEAMFAFQQKPLGL